MLPLRATRDAVFLGGEGVDERMTFFVRQGCVLFPVTLRQGWQLPGYLFVTRSG